MSSKEAKAAKAKTPNVNPIHRNAWRSMRILREWSIPAVVRTIPGATVAGVTRFVKALERHAMVEKLPGHKKGRVGDHQRYRIYAKLESQPFPPQICHLCGQVIRAKVCDPSLQEKQAETHTKKDSRSEALGRQLAAGPEMTMEELEQVEAELYPKKERQKETETDRDTEPNAADYPKEGWHVVPANLKRRLSGGLHDAT